MKCDSPLIKAGKGSIRKKPAYPAGELNASSDRPTRVWQIVFHARRYTQLGYSFMDKAARKLIANDERFKTNIGSTDYKASRCILPLLSLWIVRIR
ncbi:hypothetical protein BWI93_08655 [Siphonobacter sp. BAB-5385]|nr:hypothetical protein BWI93_08655 [Siphonobacter sp. BAB-5385]